jgi:FMN phosphatase YigB (HAD superfamily)
MRFRGAILTDLDNTVYNFVDYFGPCFRSMVHVLHRECGIPEADITRQFKEVFSKHGSVEYPFSVQKLELCSALSQEKVSSLVKKARGAFIRTRRRNLFAYPGVEDTLAWARHESIAVIAVTNSPLRLAWSRILQLGLKQYFTGIAAWNGGGHEWPEEDPVAEVYRSSTEYQPPDWVWPVPGEKLKPDPWAYSKIIEALKIDPITIHVIGDSVEKDVRPALELNANGYWAKYGRVYQDKNDHTLRQVTHWSEKKILSTYNNDNLERIISVNDFSELMNHIPSRQSVFSWSSVGG